MSISSSSSEKNCLFGNQLLRLGDNRALQSMSARAVQIFCQYHQKARRQ